MTFIAHIHPVLVHFPIALVLVAALFEAVATIAGLDRWHAFAVANVRAGAAFAVVAAVTGWRLAGAMAIDGMPALEWHRWVGTAAAVAALGAAAATVRLRGSVAIRTAYLVALFCAAALVAVTGHLGGVLVWGAEFLRP